MNSINLNSTFSQKGNQWLNSVLMSASSLKRICSRQDNVNNLLRVLKRLEADNYLQFMLEYYQKGVSQFGNEWGYCDLLLALHAASGILKPENYLEIGVRRGRSLAAAIGAHTSVNVYGFDLWVDNYAGMANPGPELVKSELQKIGHRGNIQLISGDSKETVPKFLTENQELFFDMITVDGDHSEAGARLDIENTLPRLKIGGVMLFDDISHPQHLYLNQLWDEIFEGNSKFSSCKYTELGYGVAVAVRLEF